VRIVFLGLPGSGKGTQARLLSQELSLPFIGMGDLLRAEVAQDTPLGRHLKPILDQGSFPSDELVVDIFLSHVLKEPGFIAEGIPRSDVQARLLDDAFGTHGVGLDFLFYLKLDPDEAKTRLLSRIVCLDCGVTYGPKDGKKTVCDACGSLHLGQRRDDVEEVIAKRLSLQQAKDKSVLAFYEGRPFVHEIDANLSEKEVLSKILECIRNAQ
jgi:adenylate kinase